MTINFAVLLTRSGFVAERESERIPSPKDSERSGCVSDPPVHRDTIVRIQGPTHLVIKSGKVSVITKG